MSGFYKKAVVWLGLDEEHPEGDTLSSDYPNSATEREAGAPVDAVRERGDAVRAIPPTADSRDGAPGASGPGPNPGAERTPAAERAPRKKPATPTANPLTANASYDRTEGTVRAIPMEDDAAASSGTGLSSSRSSRGTSASIGGSTGTVRAVPMPKTTKPQVVVPQSFNNAQDVADMFRDKQPVIVNMQQAERDLARRLIDFSSGLCYGLGGQMEKVAKDVYLLTPTDVEVSDADREDF